MYRSIRKALWALVALTLCVAAPSEAQVAQTGGGAGAPGAAANTPATIFGANLIAWYKADTGVYTDAGCSSPASNGNSILCWKDQSANALNLKLVNVAPTLNTTGYNSLPSLTWVVSSTEMGIGSTTSLLASATTVSAFVVGSLTASFGSGGGVYITGGGGTTASCGTGNVEMQTSTGSSTSLAACASFGNYGTATIVNGTHYRIGTIFDGTNVTTYLNNVSSGGPTSQGGFTFPSPATVGFGFGWDGPVCEVVIANVAATPTQRSQLDSYFTSHCGT